MDRSTPEVASSAQRDMSEAAKQSNLQRTQPWVAPLLGLWGAYLNAVAYGFAYGKDNHEFDLPLVNWLRDRSLYPHDPITDTFSRFPTVFWQAVAYFSRWLSTENVLFLTFWLTKILFFLALTRLVSRMVKDNRLVACVVLSVALSPFLDEPTPFGASDILNAVQTHTSLAIALLLWVGVLLVEGRWLSAAALCAVTTYLDALFVVYTLFAFAVFAVLDWPQRKRRVLLAALLGAAITLPWVLFSRGVFYRGYPGNYVEALLAFYPFHLTLRSHEAYELISGTGLVIATVLMVLLGAKAGLPRPRRLEMLAASYLVPAVLGGFFGEFLLTPDLARLQLLRADSFLILYSILLIQIYGANLVLCSQMPRLRTTLSLGVVALLFPLSDFLGLLWLLFIAMALWADPWEHLENFCRYVAGSWKIRGAGAFLVLAGLIVAELRNLGWSSTAAILLPVVGGCVFICGVPSATVSARMSKLTVGLCGMTFLIAALHAVAKPSSLWNPVVAPEPNEADWYEAQRWAKAHTPPDAQFLAPTYPSGFRGFSERSSWGEWKDGQAMYHYPPFADVYRQRMQAVGYPWRPEWVGTKTMIRNYEHLSWDHLLAVARKNHLSYIIQSSDVRYPASPVFANNSYAVYKVPQ